MELGELTREWTDCNGEPIKLGDRVELVGFERAYNPPNPQGYIYGDSTDDGYEGANYFAIWFDDDVEFKLNNEDGERVVPKPFGGFDDTSIRKLLGPPCAECESLAEQGDYLCEDCRLAIAGDCG